MLDHAASVTNPLGLLTSVQVPLDIIHSHDVVAIWSQQLFAAKHADELVPIVNPP